MVNRFRLNKRIIQACILWFTIGCGMWLRVVNADNFPIYNNDDGLFHVWAGNSILNDFSHPTSLSIFETENPRLFWRSQYRNLVPQDRFGYRLVDPWFDQPFVATLLIATPARFFGFTDFSQIPQMLVRAPALIAALFTMILIALLASALYSPHVGLLATAVYAFWPLAVFSNRQSYLENFITVFWLIGLYVLWRFHFHLTWKHWVITAFMGILAGWSKIVGYMTFITYAYFLLSIHKTRMAIAMGFAAVLSLLTYVGYGFYIDRESFSQTLFNQGGRGAYLGSITYYITHPEIQDVLADGWWLLAVLAIPYLMRKPDKAGQFITVSVLLWWLALFMVAGPNNTSPWYMNPALPLMAIALGKWLADWITLPSLPSSLFILFLGFTGLSLSGMEFSSVLIRIASILVFAVFSVPYLFNLGMFELYLKRTFVIILLILSFASNSLAVRDYPKQKCQDGTCIQPTTIKLEIP